MSLVVLGYNSELRNLRSDDCNVLRFYVDKNAIQGLGDKTVVKDESGERTERVGAGGWGGGVHLVTSDKETQDINRVNLERFFRKQRRLKEKRERETKDEEEEDKAGTV